VVVVINRSTRARGVYTGEERGGGARRGGEESPRREHALKVQLHLIFFWLPSGRSFDRCRTIFERDTRLGRSSFSFERVKDSFASYYYNIFITQQFITCGIRCVYLAVSAPCVTKKGRMCWTPPALRSSYGYHDVNCKYIQIPLNREASE
jgi:hypothetical protein